MLKIGILLKKWIFNGKFVNNSGFYIIRFVLVNFWNIEIERKSLKKNVRNFLFFLLFLGFASLFLTESAVSKEKPVYTIQLSDTKSFKEAERLFEQVKKFEFSRVDKVKSRYKIRVGMFKTRKEAFKYFNKHPEIKKISSTAYVTLNYYDSKRTILKGYFPKENGKAVKTNKETAEQISNKREIKSSNVTSSELPDKKTSSSLQKNINGITNIKNKKSVKESIKQPFQKKSSRSYIYIVIGVVLVCFVIAGIVILLFRRKAFGLEKEEGGENLLSEKLKNFYMSVLKRIPLVTSKKILEYHYRKSGDFRSLILMKLQGQDYKFILKETPSYLLKHSDDILVWKIYIEVLGQLGMYDEATKACERLAEVLKENSRPEAAENYLEKAAKYRETAIKQAESI